jgi:ribonuclease BN (tRNA processing enzyme)
MTLAILGSGSLAPEPVRGNPGQAVDTTLVFDRGERATASLRRAGINVLDVGRQ